MSKIIHFIGLDVHKESVAVKGSPISVSGLAYFHTGLNPGSHVVPRLFPRQHKQALLGLS